jgi:acetyltransferase-like isoleucine patch superfamily enzyme
MKKILSILIVLFPWKIKRYLYIKIFKYKIHKNSYIGYSILHPKKLELDENARIGHLNFCKNIDLLKINKNGILENLNWITGCPSDNKESYSYKVDRYPALIIGEESAITSKHTIDCTDTIEIGKFTTIAGNKSELLTHSINPYTNRQECNKIKIGDYNFIGTRCVILGNVTTANYSIFGALSLLNKMYNDEVCLYGGVPSKKIKELSLDEIKYFTRVEGKVS